MKKTLLATIILTVIMLFSSALMSESKAETVEKDKGFISVNQSATREVSPNQAEISFSIETADKSMQKASSENKNISNKVYSALKSLLNTDDSIKTSDYSARPQYIYTKENKKILDNYIVSNTVTVRTKKIKIVSKLVDTAISQGATNVSSLQFSAINCDCACNDLLEELTKKAYTQANSIAKSINAQIIGVKSINASCNSENTPRPVYAMMTKSANDSASPTPIESGKIRIYANVDASFYVK